MSDKPIALDEVIKELAAVLKKHDLTGTVIIQSPNNARYTMHLEASWTCIKHVEGGLQIRAKAKSGNDEERKKLENTIGTVNAMIDLQKEMTSELEKIITSFVQNGIKFSHITNRLE
jgi:hypothetical protein